MSNKSTFTRKPISTSKRYDIFARDQFICQYCGMSPPDVVLHVDHIIPVVKGGTNDQENLITSCDTCNRGKGIKLTSDAINEIDTKRRSQQALESIKIAKLFKKTMLAREKHNREICSFVCSITGNTECLKTTISSLSQAMIDHGSESVIKWFERAVSITSRHGSIREQEAMKYFHGILRRIREMNEVIHE